MPNYAVNIQLPSHPHEKRKKPHIFFLIKASEKIPNKIVYITLYLVKLMDYRSTNYSMYDIF